MTDIDTSVQIKNAINSQLAELHGIIERIRDHNENDKDSNYVVMKITYNRLSHAIEILTNETYAGLNIRNPIIIKHLHGPTIINGEIIDDEK
jgi:hypothetical protein